MADISFLENPLNVYLLKQEEFKRYIKDIQQSLNSKEYIKQSQTIDEFIKSKWNISKTQAYRYLLCAKIIDQLEEFKIQPNYERLCRSLNKYAKTPQQMKLLWGMVLKKINDNVDLITSTLVARTWNELCKDKKYSYVCHYEESIMNKIEMTIQEHSKKMKKNQLKPSTIKKIGSFDDHNQNLVNNSYLFSPKDSLYTPEMPSQLLVIPSNDDTFNGNETIELNQYKIDDQFEYNEQFFLINNYPNGQIMNSESNLSQSNLSPISSYSSLSPVIQSNDIYSSLSSIIPNTDMNGTLMVPNNNEINMTLFSYESNQYQNNENQNIPMYYSMPMQQTMLYY
ncbi:hypothetical protein BCR36DRAFT_416490 [Piromyces finnis]|uniref:Uncharacterized protein n=1 Tax=Piromyces finnis TaxID=1754191 RepID=A0A1Y1UX87_9FUNG|nr:hypothetical protein BCR36DRAFT_416490 [Piromyces finnis]|eukprot:ORX41833.1 hypothetical protein BCR36DRAFT_416490 [Piromyces finnis]